MLVDYSCDALRLLVDVSVKAVLLCGVVGLGVWIFRVRNDNVRHRLWTSALVGMLVLPVLVGATPRVPLPGWLYGLSFRRESQLKSAGGEGFIFARVRHLFGRTKCCNAEPRPSGRAESAGSAEIGGNAISVGGKRRRRITP